MTVQLVNHADVDAASIVIGAGPSVETMAVADSLNLDFNAAGEVIAIEVFNVSRTAPGLLARSEHAVAAE